MWYIRNGLSPCDWNGRWWLWSSDLVGLTNLARHNICYGSNDRAALGLWRLICKKRIVGWKISFIVPIFEFLASVMRRYPCRYISSAPWSFLWPPALRMVTTSRAASYHSANHFLQPKAWFWILNSVLGILFPSGFYGGLGVFAQVGLRYHTALDKTVFCLPYPSQQVTSAVFSTLMSILTMPQLLRIHAYI